MRSKLRSAAGRFAQGMALVGLAAMGTPTRAGVPPLSVTGNRIFAEGKPVSLAGNRLFWSNTGWGAEHFYNDGVVKWLKTDWKATVVRAALGVEAPGGYLQDRDANLARIKTVVDACIVNDVYVIIDWHSHRAESHRGEAIAFFEQMAREYGSRNHVIYEIYNEPLRISWSHQIKAYA